MNTPNIDSFFTEVAALRNNEESLRADANYHRGQLERLCYYVKPKDTSSAGVVSATINWIQRLLEDHERSQKAFREIEAERDVFRQRLNNIRTLTSSEP